ncbi:MAG: hypothetical protein ACUVXB_08415 [Bryobacteraceae bacterium]
MPVHRDEMWQLSPLNARNNVNGIGNYSRTEIFLGKDPDMQRVMDSMVRKIVAELREFDNVMFEICNEPYAYNLVPPPGSGTSRASSRKPKPACPRTSGT